jgi:hypothetical protein
VSDNTVTGQTVIAHVLSWTGGHPYLTLRLCEEYVARGVRDPDEVDLIAKEYFTDLKFLRSDVHFEQTLRFLSERVDDKLTTLSMYCRIWRDEEVRDQTSSAHIALKLAGIVKRDRGGLLAVRNAIYHHVFTEEWAVSTAAADIKQREEIAARQAAAMRNERISLA